MGAMPYRFGSRVWPGLSKLVEEMGETGEVVGKIQGVDGQDIHWDGYDLRKKLSNEIADLVGITSFVARYNGLDEEYIKNRAEEKFDLFCQWHERFLDQPYPILNPRDGGHVDESIRTSVIGAVCATLTHKGYPTHTTEAVRKSTDQIYFVTEDDIHLWLAAQATTNHKDSIAGA